MSKFLEALMEGGNLSEEAQKQIKESFDEAVNEKAASVIKEQTSILEAEFTTKTEERVAYLEKMSEQYVNEHVAERTAYLEKLTEQYVNEEIVASVDKYLTAAVAEFMKENALAVESSLKVQLADNFLNGMVTLAKESLVKLPDNAESVVETVTAKLAKVEARLAEETTKLVNAETAIVEMKKSNIVASVLVGELTESQKEKLTEKFADVEFIDEAQYKTALNKVVEAYNPVTDIKEEVEVGEVEKKDPVNESSWESFILAQLRRNSK